MRLAFACTRLPLHSAALAALSYLHRCSWELDEGISAVRIPEDSFKKCLPLLISLLSSTLTWLLCLPTKECATQYETSETNKQAGVGGEFETLIKLIRS